MQVHHMITSPQPPAPDDTHLYSWVKGKETKEEQSFLSKETMGWQGLNLNQQVRSVGYRALGYHAIIQIYLFVGRILLWLFSNLFHCAQKRSTYSLYIIQ